LIKATEIKEFAKNWKVRRKERGRKGRLTVEGIWGRWVRSK